MNLARKINAIPDGSLQLGGSSWWLHFMKAESFRMMDRFRV